MELQSIYVENILNRYTYNINLKGDITILHGANGRGKTMILQLVNCIINEDYSSMYDIPFKKIKLEFTNEKKIEVEKTYIGNEKDILPLVQLIINTNIFGYDIKYEVNIDKMIEELSIRDIIPELRKIKKNQWLDIDTSEVINKKDIVDKYGNYEDLFDYHTIITIEGYDDYEELLEDGLEKEARDFEMITEQYISSYFSLNMIETNRLYSTTESNTLAINNTLAISTYSNKIRKEFSNLLKKYANLSQEMDRTFPIRLLNRMNRHDLNYNSTNGKMGILEQLKEQNSQRQYLSELGLLESESKNLIPISNISLNDLDTAYTTVLSLYLEDNKEKLGIFDDIKERIALFLKILNNRFKDKQISLNKNDGFVIELSNGYKMKKFYQLSSGEQHSIVLFFKLLLENYKSDLVIIDEPELSLHISWQMDFLHELKEISNLTRQKFLIATHSPEIINEEWELMVELTDEDSFKEEVENYATKDYFF